VTAAPRPAGPGYPGTTVAAGVLATLFFPLISLIVALVPGPCVGGPEVGEDATVCPDGTAVFPCSISGTATITVDKQ
jgi:hypothetical protein